MTRSAKGPYVDPRVMRKAQQAKAGGEKGVIKTWLCSSDIHPDFVVPSMFAVLQYGA